jgi:ATP-dependent RNA helicase DDX23/PRP28
VLVPAKKAKKGWASQRKQPPSIDDILKAKREQEAAAAKPKFLSKAERERIALEKRQREVEEARKRRDVSTPNASGASQYGPAHANGSHDASSSIPTGPRAMRPDAQERRHGATSAAGAGEEGGQAAAARGR